MTVTSTASKAHWAPPVGKQMDLSKKDDGLGWVVQDSVVPLAGNPLALKLLAQQTLKCCMAIKVDW